MSTIVVAGALANKPDNGGEAWVRLSWIIGLQRLGFDVLFLEEIDPATCVDSSGRPANCMDSRNLAYWREVTDSFGLTGSSALVADSAVFGMSRAELDDRALDAELLVNISGNAEVRGVLTRIPRRVFLDLDPGYTQFWHAQRTFGGRLADHTHFFTVGLEVGREDCLVPTSGIDWRPIDRIAVLDEWPRISPAEQVRFTTIASWRGGHGPILHQGRTLGLKAHEFRRFAGLPRMLDARFQIALDIHPGDANDRQMLLDNGWELDDPRIVARTPEAFRTYVQRSGAEFAAAQGIYVETRSGWFADRTVRYLCSGRPALVQDTGFSRHYPVGSGLLTFRTMEEAAVGVEMIVRNYEQHCEAARDIAEAHFDSDRILSDFIEALGVSP